MNESPFCPHSRSKTELALCYRPDLRPSSARNFLVENINRSPALLAELDRLGYDKHRKRLTSSQVKAIVAHLGEP